MYFGHDQHPNRVHNTHDFSYHLWILKFPIAPKMVAMARNSLPRCIAFFNRIPFELLKIRNSNAMHLGDKFFTRHSYCNLLLQVEAVIQEGTEYILETGVAIPRCPGTAVAMTGIVFPIVV